MTRGGHRIGIAGSLLLHLGLAGTWLGLQSLPPSMPAGGTDTPLPLTLAMFADGPADVSADTPEGPAEPVVEPKPAPEPQPVAEPKPEPPAPLAAAEPRLVEPVTAPAPKPKPKPKPEATKPKAAARAATQPRVTAAATPASAPIRTAAVGGSGQSSAQSTTTPRPSARPSPAETAAGRELEGTYLAKLRRTIEARKYYPRQARRARHEGTVKVRFKVLRDGSFETAEVVGSSGSTLLDAAALETVNRVGRFAPFPNGMGKSYLVLSLPLSYELR